MFLKHLLFILCVTLLFINTTHAQVAGCTDTQASNYNSNATINDGSCVYVATTIAPTLTLSLSDSIIETSGLIQFNNHFYTHNDNTDLNLYALDTLTGGIIKKIPLTNCLNIDWEEVSQDSLYLYVGDFGNNVNGNRTNLQILRISKTSVLANSPIIDTILFSYSNQTNFIGSGANNTKFDCEAFIVSRDSIFLFTKQWVDKKTTVYALSKQIGTHTALLRDSLNVQGLVTGATYLEDKRVIALCGYTQYLQPFITLLYDFKQHHFFKGNKRRLDVSLPFYQTEAISSRNGTRFYVSNEKFVNSSITTNQRIHLFDISSILHSYYFPTAISEPIETINNDYTVTPNPTQNELVINGNTKQKMVYNIYNIHGDLLMNGSTETGKSISVSHLKNGAYTIKLEADLMYKTIKFIKQ